MYMVETLEINERTIAPGLKIMAEEILLHSYEFYHVLTFLVFCMELEKHCKVCQHPWYTRKKLVDIIVNILYEAGYTPPPTPGRDRGNMFDGIQCTIM